MNKVKYYIGTLLILTTVVVYSQTTGPEANYAIYQKKLKKSEEQKTDPKKNTNSKYWLSRAELMMDIFELHRNQLQKGSLELQVIALYPSAKKTQTSDDNGNPITVYESDIVKIIMKEGKVDSYTEKAALYQKPLPEAMVSLEKAQEYDTDGKLDKKIKEEYLRLKKDFELIAIEHFLEDEFEASFKSFASIAKVNEKAIMEGVVDTTFLYYAGMSATRANMHDEAIEYFEKARKNNYPEADLYYFLKQEYFTTGDTTKGITALEQGFERFPDNLNIVNELINYYLATDNTDEAIEYINIAKEKDPSNISLYFVEGYLYDKSGETEKARDKYEKCIELDPEYYNAYYNLGVMFYNKAVEEFQKADEIRDPNEYDAAKAEAEEILKKSLPYMEKAYPIAEKNTTWAEADKISNMRSTLETLKTLYYRMENIEKYDEVKAKLEALPAAKEGGIQ